MIGNGVTQNGGRRTRVTTEGRALPLFMSASRSRVIERVQMSAATSRELQKYLRWAAKLANLTKDEAQVMMLDRAIGEFLRKDDAWQAEKASNGSGDDGGEGSGEDAEDADEAPTPRPSVNGQAWRQSSPPAAPRGTTEVSEVSSKTSSTSTDTPKAK
jgi:hypothetical protein